MAQLESNRKSDRTQKKLQDPVDVSVLWTLVLIRLVGYGFLILAFFDVIHILFPPRFMDPSWEFQSIGNFVERAAIPLLGFVMIFSGKQLGRYSWESNLLKLLSWMALLLGIINLLIIPLGIFDTVRLHRTYEETINIQVEQSMGQFQQLQQRLERVKTPNELELFSGLMGINFELSSEPSDLGKARKDFIQKILERSNRMKNQADQTLYIQRLGLLKNSIKWNIGALISAFLYLVIWQLTRGWTRLSLRRRH